MEGTKRQSSSVIATLVANHRRFLKFLTHRMGNTFDAEEILQAAFLKSVKKSDSIRDSESVQAWFYRLLRNAVIDYYRHRDAERRALERMIGMRMETEVPEPDIERAICQCMYDLLPTLKDDYSLLLRRIDLEGARIVEVAAANGMTANNTRVKLHRARAALRKQLELSCGSCVEHACLDCDCRRPP
ncbi:MAG: sigma-70 family RNA polymerase sigma factor [Deltaproteobacteria bacterium]|nr:MAG: sigma-70 family RNA polymerase sigma factor [Deltaproteobacteria bacterium]